MNQGNLGKEINKMKKLIMRTKVFNQQTRQEKILKYYSAPQMKNP